MKFLLSIRGKLLLVSLILLAIPLLGYQFIRDMETYLREGQERALESSTRALAVTLSERPHLFARETNPDDQAALERRQVLALFGSSDPETVASLGAAYQPSEEIERILEVVGRRASRVWVVDTQSRVRGLYGSLKNRPPPEAETIASAQVSKALTRLFDIPSPDAKDDPKSAAKAVMAHVDRALIGAPSSFWRITQDKRGIVLSSAQPIWSGDNIVGAVVVEETTGAIQLLKLNALENLLTITAIVFVAGFLTLVLFAWRLAARVRQLGRQAERAIDAQGRIRSDIEPSTTQDELGELSRSLAATVKRLKDYNAHLENMAGRLSHELRTPVAVVRSSLDNLKLHQGDQGKEAAVYIERADQGVTRLSTLIGRLSEATQLERFLQHAERENFDLAQVVAGSVEGYRQAYPKVTFAVSCEPAELKISGVPDAIVQLLDKLVSNAIDFHTPGTPIEVALQRHGGFAKLAVSNQGPLLSQEIGATLFSSMVSLRPDEHADKPGAVGHLGLGLYIVRLIAEFHGGNPVAENRRDGLGVTVAVYLPI